MLAETKKLKQIADNMRETMHSMEVLALVDQLVLNQVIQQVGSDRIELVDLNEVENLGQVQSEQDLVSELKMKETQF